MLQTYSHLAPYALRPDQSRGRFLPESALESERDDFQKDRDRIIHSKAFRRLARKTQVFVSPIGDHYRNRLTHSLEVAQIARSCARALRVNEDLAELAGLAHDMGHPPFGHTGEYALDECMRDYGGFDHNGQALRIVTRLENRYFDYRGLNLTYESLEAIVQHNGPLLSAVNAPETELCRAILDFPFYRQLNLAGYAGLEAQLAAICDDIAYNAHDIDDGLRSGLLSLQELEAVPICGEILSGIHKTHPSPDPEPARHELCRRLIGFFVKSVLAQTRENLSAFNIKTPDDIRGAKQAIAVFNPEAQKKNAELKRFLAERMYHHPQIKVSSEQAKEILKDLFKYYMRSPEYEIFSEEARAVHVCDFIAGMTDKFATERQAELKIGRFGSKKSLNKEINTEV